MDKSGITAEGWRDIGQREFEQKMNKKINALEQKLDNIETVLSRIVVHFLEKDGINFDPPFKKPDPLILEKK